MKGGTLQIIWHDSLPVLSLDFHIDTKLLATAGADHDIKLWTVAQKDDEKGSPFVVFKANLSFHTTAVNVIRFSPSGELLASGADGGHLALWKRALNADSVMTWKVMKQLSFHPKDVLDLEWSPDGTSLISGSVDNSCIIWSVAKGAPLQVLNDHLHYVQGVAWDPAGQYVATVSGDRTCRIYLSHIFKSSSKGQDKGQLENFVCQHVLAKVHLRMPVDMPVTMEETGNSAAKMTRQHLFHDENLPTFFRRLAWSPEGSFLVIPAGIYRPSSDAAPFNTTCVVARKDLSRPALQLPCGKKAVVAVRFCPIIFTLRLDSDSWGAADPDGKVFRLPYRLVFAVATLNSLYIYDTQNDSPVAILAGLHYAAITDLAWSPDAKFLAASSQDGYCTLLAFEDGELGQPMPVGDIPQHVASYLPEERRKLLQSLVESSSPNNKSSGEALSMETSQPHLEKNGADQKREGGGDRGAETTGPSLITMSARKPQRITPTAISEDDTRAPGENSVGSIATSHPPNGVEHKIRRVVPIPVLPEGAS